jgi:hypothetical protein
VALEASYCSNCGEKLTENDRFCPKCGSAVSVSAIHTREDVPTEKPDDAEPKAQPPPTKPPTPEEKEAWPPPGQPPPPPAQQPPPPPDDQERRGGKLPSWPILAAIAGGVAALIAIVLVAINWAPEERVATVTAPELDPSLTVGGLSSGVVGLDASVESLQQRKPDGFRLLADAIDENVVDEFQQSKPSAKWTSEFSLNDDELTLFFDGRGGDDEFFLDYPGGQNKTADKIFAIARVYGFYTDDTRTQLTEIEERVNSIIDDFTDRQLTEGVAESDLVSQANAAADDLDQWLQDFGDYDVEVRAVEAELAVMKQLAAVAQNPTDAGLDEYNRLIDEMNDAIDEYNEAT